MKEYIKPEIIEQIIELDDVMGLSMANPNDVWGKEMDIWDIF